MIKILIERTLATGLVFGVAMLKLALKDSRFVEQKREGILCLVLIPCLSLWCRNVMVCIPDCFVVSL